MIEKSKAFFNLSQLFSKSRFNSQKALFCKILAQYPVGRLFFRANLMVKKTAVLFGFASQRAAEYPWIIRSLELIPKTGLFLDVGCAESLLSHELIAKGLTVVGLDIRDCPFKDKRVAFVKRNIIHTGFPDGMFDAVGIVSTIEHIGLEPYGQTVKDTDGDIKVITELKRILKNQGIILLTTPYIGAGPLRVDSFEREYSAQRLSRLTAGLKIVHENYYYPSRSMRRLQWLELSKEEMDKQTFTEPGIACLILKKQSAN
jgi:SAM-dependent methyltransferase